MTTELGPLADREWRLIPEESRTGPMQMALEEVAAETAVAGGPRTVRAFRWEPSTLSLGYRQEPHTVDWDYCEAEGIDVTRRQTGGGGIYHDHDADISYSVIAPADELPGDLMETYAMLCSPVLHAFDRMGVDAAFADAEQPAIHEPTCYLRAINPAHDIVATPSNDPDGASTEATPKKLSGNAQYRQREAVIQHGSLSYALATDHHLGVFADPGIDEERFRERVTSLREQAGVSRADAVDHLEAALTEWADAEVGQWTDAELDRARELAETKYASESWLRERVVAED
ncbi:biotin/lipoate A/B protein ligase [Salinarchaeum sp. Harcht-Bsk1]|uniref:lipoate--protein ligase family protein n=1 Tax=Salinarchaeum sp. Harcht-Bsk1 TaxID=1333523 RepID=UPI00034242B8|nr:biotin/lipoate A/B protein ligase family protein [Salinarchaeum sp. Harcht-Bsk1]AGN00279.1 biotin/lipoate A/B protein ligase [Salinarchaeum sp. Harcht-Bsk1]